jgi:hypothetical protein
MHQSDVQKDQGDAPVRWRITTATGVRFACRVVITGARIEVRLTTGSNDLVCATVVPTLDAAQGIAHGWLRALVAGDDVDRLAARSRADVVH